MKDSKKLERHFKGIANHRRIDILKLIKKNESLTLQKICQTLNCNIKMAGTPYTRHIVSS